MNNKNIFSLSLLNGSFLNSGNDIKRNEHIDKALKALDVKLAETSQIAQLKGDLQKSLNALKENRSCQLDSQGDLQNIITIAL